MNALIDLQRATEYAHIPSLESMSQWVAAVLKQQEIPQAELTVRVVDEAESQSLNATYRQKDKPTNVLSFAMDTDVPLEVRLLGDLVICAPVVAQEAEQQGKPLAHHWAHMLIHGTLHLLGYDHITDTEAEEMEELERRILREFSIPDPYLAVSHNEPLYKE
ncbi:rRNA maturation RNase YbeY [Aliidiomarina taiwanensis]|uniref:Endoribonuclease YbeY n=1 Tax=Aliidiomarina taiwanensis TaxID=946228 RepID=A0A432X9H8_9GAMM|nr:rRNA maturation RNase YbeY [Aliidiomarina taiwanensis]RUO43891.1 rRNA maturation RNase YbeY [Aliidiomarina taiwanensis]